MSRSDWFEEEEDAPSFAAEFQSGELNELDEDWDEEDDWDDDDEWDDGEEEVWDEDEDDGF